MNPLMHFFSLYFLCNVVVTIIHAISLFHFHPRKSFLGMILSSERGKTTHPKERVIATSAAVVSAVQQGALVVRVHDVHEMADVVSVADAIWR